MINSVDFREYIVDLMADPGTLLPSDAVGLHIDYDDSFYSASPLSRDIDSSHVASSSSGVGSSFEEHSLFGTSEKRPRFRSSVAIASQPEDSGKFDTSSNFTGTIKGGEESNKFPSNIERVPAREVPGRSSYPYTHARSPSWTEGVSSPAARRMKVKDVSQYMIDAAKENPQLAQKLHDVLLESGVVAPPNLFTEIYQEQLDASTAEVRSPTEMKDENKQGFGTRESKDQDDLSPARFLPPLPRYRVYSKATPHFDQPEYLNKPAEGLGFSFPDIRESTGQSSSPQSDVTPIKYRKDVPVAAAAAAAAAAVVASSMVAAAATDSNIELPVAAAATATAAAMVATTAAVTKQYEQGARSDGDTDSAGYEPRGSGGLEHGSFGANLEGERVSDRSAGNDSTKSDLDDVAECEIPWEELTLGERIGLGMNPYIMLCNTVPCFI